MSPYVLALLAILSVAGTVGNALVVYVFATKTDKQPLRIFVIAMAVVDLLTCAVELPASMAVAYNQQFYGNDFLCKWYIFLAWAPVPFSAFIITAIAADRYLCICRPLVRALNSLRAKIVVACIGLLACVMGLVSSLRFKVNIFPPMDCYNYTDPESYALPGEMGNLSSPIGCNNRLAGGGASVCTIDLDNPGSRAYMSAYRYVQTALLLLCAVVIAVLYALVFKRALADRRRFAPQTAGRNVAVDAGTTAGERAECATAQVTVVGSAEDGDNSERQSTDRNREQDVSYALMFFVVAALFFVNYLLTVVFVGIMVVYYVSDVANPVIYFLMSKTFRDDVKKLFSCK